MPRENAVEIEIQTGVIIFRGSEIARRIIENLLLKQKESSLDKAD